MLREIVDSLKNAVKLKNALTVGAASMLGL